MNKTGNADKTEAVGTAEIAVETGKFAGHKRLFVILLSVAVAVSGIVGAFFATSGFGLIKKEYTITYVAYYNGKVVVEYSQKVRAGEEFTVYKPDIADEEDYVFGGTWFEKKSGKKFTAGEKAKFDFKSDVKFTSETDSGWTDNY